LLEYENEPVTTHLEHEDGERGVDVQDTVDLLVDNLANKVEEEGGPNEYEEVVGSGVVHNTDITVVQKELAVTNILPESDNALQKTVPTPVVSDGLSSTAKIIHTTSCPGGLEDMSNSGPWSIDWLSEHYDADDGIVFSSKKKKWRCATSFGS
jgi:hypothetical protein